MKRADLRWLFVIVGLLLSIMVSEASASDEWKGLWRPLPLDASGVIKDIPGGAMMVGGGEESSNGESSDGFVCRVYKDIRICFGDGNGRVCGMFGSSR